MATADAKKISHLFRSRDSDKEFPIDPRLIAFLDQIEDHFGVRQVEIISGYRSGAFNRELKETGHHVAGKSLHTKGMAVDIHLDEISEEALRDYATSLKKGGVGYYPSLNMVHVDVGEVREWAESSPRKKWVGEKNLAVPLTLTVAPERTRAKRLNRLTFTQEDPRHPVSWQKDLEVEFFLGAEWKKAGSLRVSAGDSISLLQEKVWESMPCGKYRLRAVTLSKEGTSFQFSNEFYFKKE